MEEKNKVVIMIPQEYKQEAEELMNFLETLEKDKRTRFLDLINGAKTMQNLMDGTGKSA